MRTQVLILAFIGIVNLLHGQSNDIRDYFKMDPCTIPVEISVIQEYEVTFKFSYSDPFSGKASYSEAAKANFFVMPGYEYVGWRNVKVGQINNMKQDEFAGEHLSFFDNFSYKPQYNFSTDFLKEDFYKDIPEKYRDWARWFVMDEMQMIEQGWFMLDSLEFQEDFYPSYLDDLDITYEGSGNFSNKYQKFVWSGITEHNSEICAVVKFESFFNPFDIKHGDITVVQGRSLYYGEMWISLEDKEVEYSVMVEDVIRMLPQSGQLTNMQREIVFNKIK